MRFCRSFVLALSILIWSLDSTSAISADASEKLMELLIKKGIITQQEAKVLREEVEKEEKPEQPVGTPVKVGEQTLPAEKTVSGEPLVPDWLKDIRIGYDDGAYIKTEDDRFAIKFNLGIQPLFSYESLDDESDETTFQIRRARFYMRGNAFYPWLNYVTQITLDGGSASLRDAYLEAAYWDGLKPRAGQFKVPYDREYLTSGFSLEFIDRSIASDEFSLERDIGLQVSGKLFGEHLAYAVGVFNGSGANQTNVDKDYMYVGRVVLMPFEDYPYSQGAVDHPESPLLAFGLGAAYLPGLEPGERDRLAGSLGDEEIVPVESDVLQFVADFAFKYRNFSTEAGYHFRYIEPDDPTPFGTETAFGLYVQAGYFLIPRHFQLAARYSYVDPDNPTSVGNNDRHEGTAAANYYLYGHRLKLQAAYTFLSSEDEPDDKKDHIFQSTAVLLF